MKSLFKKFFIFVLKSLKKFLLSHQKLRVMLYDLQNKEEFENLYEHEKMLADAVRINTYKRAIEKLIGPDDVVLDLGTGTGILAFFAAKQKAKKVYAIDHSNFINIAREIAKHNNLKNIEFIQSHSRNFKTDVLFDVILHEQIGDYLFNENMIQNILDLKNRLLKPNGRIIPGRFELFLEPIMLQKSFNIPFIWENEIYGIDFSFLKKHYEDLEEYMPSNYKQEWLETDAVNEMLCEAKPIYTFDLNTLNSPKEIPQVIETSKQVLRAGYFDGFCLFFKVLFDEEIQFDTSPLTPYTHWGNCFFRVESRKCYRGELIKFKLNMPDLFNILTWSVTVKRFKASGANELDSKDQTSSN